MPYTAPVQLSNVQSSDEGAGLFAHLLHQLSRLFTDPTMDALVGGPLATLYHGTSLPAATGILQRGFDAARAGSGPLTTHGQQLRDLTASSLHFGVPGDTSIPRHYAQAASQQQGVPGALVESFIDDTLLHDLRTRTPGIGYDFPHLMAEAQRLGKRGVILPDETVVFHPDALRILRVLPTNP